MRVTTSLAVTIRPVSAATEAPSCRIVSGATPGGNLFQAFGDSMPAIDLRADQSPQCRFGAELYSNLTCLDPIFYIPLNIFQLVEDRVHSLRFGRRQAGSGRQT